MFNLSLLLMLLLKLFKESECRVAKGKLFHSLITDGRKES